MQTTKVNTILLSYIKIISNIINMSYVKWSDVYLYIVLLN